MYVTEQEPEELSVQVLELNEPPVAPAVKVKVTVPVGPFDPLVVSVTAVITATVQVVEPDGMLQLTFPTVIDVPSFTTTTELDEPVLPLCVESPL